ncbi:FAD-binding oxidoreductase [Novosphingobium sp. 1949]|uniref:FAD-binding oxidoreductase n=1 Tax=Novosphingobium organovorum TaxID=2930092 RepID=A0ABT0BAY2_9SPHN|nr:FAD-binding oxidoreductase [Novosphingobium organovorum]MCJ2181981.1 FAD-binding oxidoreductase [Novosphingobium organovorum]
MTAPMTLPPETLAAFEALVGPSNVLTAPGDMATYAEDGRGTRGEPGLVVRPGSSEEVRAVLALAFARGLRVVPQGARTGLVAAGLAQSGEGQLLLSLERLKGTIAIDPVNRSVTLGAGTLLSELNAAAEEHGLFFPIDLGADPSIGGMIGANTGGARLLRYGDLRKNLMGLELVTAEKTPRILQLGSALWKNNAALCLQGLVAGSSGALGVVTSATLALSPKPVNTVTALLALPHPEVALDILARMEDAFGTLLTAFEGISRPALSAAIRHVPSLRDPFGGEVPGYCVLLELSGGRAVAAEWLEETLAETLEPLFEDGRIADTRIDRGTALWAVRHAVPEGLRRSGKVVACDIAMKRGDVMRFRTEIAERLAAIAPQLELHDFGHIGDGGLHCNCVWPESAGPYDPAVAEAARAAIFTSVVEDYTGSFSAEHGVGPANYAWYERFTPPDVLALSGALQALIAPMPFGRVDFGPPGG